MSEILIEKQTAAADSRVFVVSRQEKGTSLQLIGTWAGGEKVTIEQEDSIALKDDGIAIELSLDNPTVTFYGTGVFVAKKGTTASPAGLKWVY